MPGDTPNRNQSPIRRAASWLVFPVVMTAGLLLVHYLMNTGTEAGIAVLVVSIPFAFLIGGIERLLPYRTQWLQSQKDVGTDLLHMFLVQIAIPKIAQPLWAAALVTVVAALAERFGSGLWPHAWPLPAQLFLMLVIAEFGRYWVHRAAHEIPALWRLHAVHHSPKRLYWLNAARFHPIEKVIFLVPEVIPFVLLGTNAETLALYQVFNSIHGLFQHANIDVKLGPLNYLFSMAELHRWHHSREIDESNRNYGNNLIIWDIIFGTWFLPEDREIHEIGLLIDDYPQDFVGQMVVPFKPEGNAKPADWAGA